MSTSTAQKKVLVRKPTPSIISPPKKKLSMLKVELPPKEEEDEHPQLPKEEEEEDPKKRMVFTRYYYVKQSVFSSLWISILDKKIHEALFWAYELYYSDFAQEVFEFLMYVYYDFFWIYNSSDFEKCMLEEFNMWLKNKDDGILGNMVANLICRPYSIIPFLKKMYIPPKDFSKQDYYKYFETDLSIYIMINPKMFDIYKTRELLPNETVHVLQKYKIRINESQLIYKTMEDAIDLYETYENWHSFLNNSSIWKKRIEDVGGTWNEIGMPINMPPNWEEQWRLNTSMWTDTQKEYIGLVNVKEKYGWEEFYEKYYLNTPQRMDEEIEFSKMP